MVSRKKQELLNERLALQARINRINGELANLPDDPDADARPSARPVRISASGSSLRELVIAIVSEVGYMVTNTSIRYVYEARFDKNLPASQLNELSDLERQQQKLPGGALYGLVHPVRLKGESLVHITNIWARADWSIRRRICLPVTMRLINLHFLDWYITNHGSRHHGYLSSSDISAYIGELVRGLGLGSEVNRDYGSVYAKKVIIGEIEKARSEEATIHSGLAFKIISGYRQGRKNHDAPPEEVATLLK